MTISVLVEGGSESELCSGGRPIVLLLVEEPLRVPLSARLTRFADDLCSDGYRVWLAASGPATPPEIRAYPANAWERSGQSFTGAMLIGDIPYAYQFVVLHSTNPAFPDVREEVISFQYYADVNGGFSASSGYVGSRNYSYDIHDGDVNWELWIGVLPLYKGSTTATISALRWYFDKNHAYRTGGTKPARAFLQINELQSASTPAEEETLLGYMRDGAYSWTPFSNSTSAQLYFGSPSTGRSVLEGYAALGNGTADFTVQDAHGYHLAAGPLYIDSVETNPVRTVFFFGAAVAPLATWTMPTMF